MMERIICSKSLSKPNSIGNTNQTGHIARCRGLDRGDGMKDDERKWFELFHATQQLDLDSRMPADGLSAHERLVGR